MNLFWFFDISSGGSADKYLLNFDPTKDNTPAFLTAGRFFQNSIVIQSMAIMFVLQYGDAMTYVDIIVLICTFCNNSNFRIILVHSTWSL